MQAIDGKKTKHGKQVDGQSKHYTGKFLTCEGEHGMEAQPFQMH